MHSNYTDFIGVFHDSISKDVCNYLIDLLDSSQDIAYNKSNARQDAYVGIKLTHPIEDTKVLSYKQQLSKCLQAYGKQYKSVTALGLINTEVKLQRTEIFGGYHTWHYEDAQNPNRDLVYMTYLNDLDPDDGTTEFLYQKTKFTPKAGTTLIWPTCFTHMHRGNPPYHKTKYIATGWYTRVVQDHPLAEKWA